METLIVLTVIFTVVTGLLYMILRSTTAFKDGVEATNRDAQLMAEIERLNEALADVSLDLAQVTQELQETRKTLKGVQYYRDKLISVMQTTLGFVQLHTGNGFFGTDAPFGEKLPQWFDNYDNGERDRGGSIEGWEQVRKDLEAVLPKVGA